MNNDHLTHLSSRNQTKVDHVSRLTFHASRFTHHASRASLKPTAHVLINRKPLEYLAVNLRPSSSPMPAPRRSVRDREIVTQMFVCRIRFFICLPMLCFCLSQPVVQG